MTTVKPKEKTVLITVSLKMSDVKKLDVIKEKTGNSKSKIVRTLIRNEFSLTV